MRGWKVDFLAPPQRNVWFLLTNDVAKKCNMIITDFSKEKLDMCNFFNIFASHTQRTTYSSMHLLTFLSIIEKPGSSSCPIFLYSVCKNNFWAWIFKRCQQFHGKLCIFLGLGHQACWFFNTNTSCRNFPTLAANCNFYAMAKAIFVYEEFFVENRHTWRLRPNI